MSGIGRLEGAKAPNTLGEWDIEIATQSTKDLEAYREALQAIRRWDAFNKAFAWTRIFVLEQSIGFELEKRSKKR